MRITDLADAAGVTCIAPAGTDVSSVSVVDALPPHEAEGDMVTMIQSVDQMADVRCRAVVTPVAVDRPATSPPIIQMVHRDPSSAFAAVVAMFRPPIDPRSSYTADPADHLLADVHPTAVIGRGVRIGRGTVVRAGAVVSDHATIGVDCVIGPNVTVHEYSVIGDRCRLAAGCVVGAEGFGYRRVGDRHEPAAQLGYVVLEDDVDLGAATTVDRGSFGTTRIGAGTKIDNQVMIAHNCQIGRRNLICSQVGIAGSCRTGDDCILAGQVGLKDHVTLGDGTIVGAQAGVMADLVGGEVYLGSPATTQKEQMQIMAVQRKLPEMRREIKRLNRSLPVESAAAVRRAA